MTGAFSRRKALTGALAGLPALAIIPAGAGQRDPVLSTIDRHRGILTGLESVSSETDEARFNELMDQNEAYVQALARMHPTTPAGAAAMLRHIMEREAVYIDFNGSPLGVTVLTVAAALERMR